MDRLQEQKHRFSLLVKQMDLPDEWVERFFLDGQIDKLEIYKQNKEWIFHFTLQRLVPADVFAAFNMRLTQTFSHLAKVDAHYRYLQKPQLDLVVNEYWDLLVAGLEPSLNSLAVTLRSARKQVDQNEVKVYLPTEMTVEVAKRKRADNELIAAFQKATDCTMRFSFHGEESDEAYKAFVEQRAEEERALVEVVMTTAQQDNKGSDKAEAITTLMMGYEIKDAPIPIIEIQEEERRIVIQGTVFNVEVKELRSGRHLLTFNITDYTDSLTVKMFSRDKEDVKMLEALKDGMWVKARGSVQHDTFIRELVMNANDLNQIEQQIVRKDTAEEKRVELHCHTPMSALDAVASVKSLVSTAAKWGHKAIAVTDHGVVQAFPEAYSVAKKNNIKCILGMEAYVIEDGIDVVYNLNAENNYAIDENTEYVVFDTETTGLNAAEHTIIEVAAVKMKGAEIVDQWTELIDPQLEIGPKTTEITGITNEMLRGQETLDVVLRKFKEFTGDAVLVAHNAEFDKAFINACAKRIGMEPWNNAFLDTLPLARMMYKGMRNYRLGTLAKKFNVELINAHRALDDTVALAHVFQQMLKDIKEAQIQTMAELNERSNAEADYKSGRPFHATILVQNKEGLKNLYKLVSRSHVETFYRWPRIQRSQLIKYREGLLIGTACKDGELMQAILRGKSIDELKDVAAFYDYLEIQPVAQYSPLLRNEEIPSLETMKGYHKMIVDMGKELNKLVVATGDVHFLNPQDEIFRDVFLLSKGDPVAGNQPPLYLHTTDEMLESFSFLGEELAQEIVVKNSNAIADMIEDVSPIPDKLYTPIIEGADDELRQMCYDKARHLYGEPLPEIVESRLEKELTSIIKHGFGVIYLISQRLVTKSLNDGYLVGSRGSVGSSFVATMSEITEVNPLPPHYRCPNCKHNEFITDGSIASGFDLPDKECPSCGTSYAKDGQDIPFETFLGFKGDKVPDIDLNFSGDYQPRAHKYTQELFGPEYVYRAGTIGTVAEKTAYGYVRKYADERGMTLRNAEISRIVNGCTGVKRTTGQHPGGIIVVPSYMEIEDFCPIQFPADDNESEWRTTHFDFHSIHDNLLKLDILGHDDPTVIRMLQDLTGMDPKTIPLDDKQTMSIFSTTEALGVTPEQIGTNMGTLGIPEFGTKFVRQMLEDTKPTTFAELVQISGLSHGTDVWLNNAQDLIRNGTCKLPEVIGCRDDIMVYLIYKGLDPSRAFKIMESVRKGKGVPEEDQEEMRNNKVPDWYIQSCQRIKYMFPKAHATAYVMMAVRIAYFKVHRPLEFYATYFTVRADDFDIPLMVKGSAAIKQKIEEIEGKGHDAQPKEKALLTVLEMALEMVERGFRFTNVDLYASDASRFLIDGNSLIAPFNALPGLGTNAAISIVNAREQGEFLSKEDLLSRSRISKTILEYLEEQGALKGLPESNQLSLF
ncbi:DNA polymerase III PolC-type [Brevibacillus reuszeri]|uniref:DNA polymerase III PolC-type n=1 Tax=Brevibacillus reuszeri TaxID=54915 RepID=A0A0K9YX09_9BACL|nr:PolC-type DNA polymerase III [Brevibacillus reuszeri]KNB72765.1 DNA polymerase III PolC [Brevibacillus reuszeri]MED1860530.1 PolC-type DNA polymerase III [Brevibacillus reuszeri]GED70199.1 DNA polymerase III PolC-type [Brevibacillus reuszeri]